jgi:hypothetical protein
MERVAGWQRVGSEMYVVGLGSVIHEVPRCVLGVKMRMHSVAAVWWGGQVWEALTPLQI